MKTVAGPEGAQCLPTGYYVGAVEQAVVAAVLDAAQRPEAVVAALAAYSETPPAEDDAADSRRELAAADRALAALGKEEAATVQAQIQGIMQGAPTDAYAAAFADLAARRKDMEDRRGALSRRVREVPRTKGQALERGMALDQQALADTARVLSSPTLPGQVKRDALAFLIEYVIPRRSGDKKGRRRRRQRHGNRGPLPAGRFRGGNPTAY